MGRYTLYFSNLHSCATWVPYKAFIHAHILHSVTLGGFLELGPNPQQNINSTCLWRFSFRTYSRKMFLRTHFLLIQSEYCTVVLISTGNWSLNRSGLRHNLSSIYKQKTKTKTVSLQFNTPREQLQQHKVTLYTILLDIYETLTVSGFPTFVSFSPLAWDSLNSDKVAVYGCINVGVQRLSGRVVIL